jgi:hypothetical protein
MLMYSLHTDAYVLLVLHTGRALRHLHAQQQYEEKLHAVKDAVRAWMHRAGESRPMKQLSSMRHHSRAEHAAAADGNADHLGVAAAENHSSTDIPTRTVSRRPSFKKVVATAVAGHQLGKRGDTTGLEELDSTEPGGNGVTGVTGVTSVVGSSSEAAVGQSLLLKGRTIGESSGAVVAAPVGQDGGHLSHTQADDAAAVAPGNNAAAEKFHTAESMKIIDAAMDAVEAAMLASSPKDGRVAAGGGASGHHHHHAHLGVGAARMIPRESSWSTVSTVGVSADYLDRLDQGTDQPPF